MGGPGGSGWGGQGGCERKIEVNVKMQKSSLEGSEGWGSGSRGSVCGGGGQGGCERKLK